MKYNIMEIWKNIEGYENVYQVSNYGRVRSLDRETLIVKGSGLEYKCFYKGKFIKPRIGDRGYLYVNLSTGNRKSYKVHRLVAKQFLEKIPNKSIVNHIDGNKLNNNASNLEWCTTSENVKHAFDTGLQISQKGSEHGISKLKESEVVEIRNLYDTGLYTQRFLANKFNISTPIMHMIVKRKSWKHV
jgi:hypothetical protein